MPVTNSDAVLWYNVGEFGKADQVDVAIDHRHRRLAHDFLLIALAREDVEASELIGGVLLDESRGDLRVLRISVRDAAVGAAGNSGVTIGASDEEGRGVAFDDGLFRGHHTENGGATFELVDERLPILDNCGFNSHGIALSENRESFRDCL